MNFVSTPTTFLTSAEILLTRLFKHSRCKKVKSDKKPRVVARSSGRARGNLGGGYLLVRAEYGPPQIATASYVGLAMTITRIYSAIPRIATLRGLRTCGFASSQ